MLDPSLRSLGIGSSEIASIVSEHPYLSEFDLWVRKTSLLPATETPRMKWGRLLQQAIAQGYAETTGRHAKWFDKTDRVEENGITLVATIDAFSYPSADSISARILECKNISLDQRHTFGESGTADVPPYIQLQVAWQMAVYARLSIDPDLANSADIAALFGGNDLRIFHLERDLELESHLIEIASRWWQDHIIGHRPPQISDTETARKWLAQHWPKSNGDMRPATLDEINYARSYAAAQEQEKCFKDAKDEAGILLRAAVEDLDGFEWPGGRVTYKANKDKKVTDWEGVAKMVVAQCHLPEDYQREVVDHHTTTVPGSRVLRVRLKGEEE